MKIITSNDQRKPQHILRAPRTPPGLLEQAHSQATVEPKVTIKSMIFRKQLLTLMLALKAHFVFFSNVIFTWDEDVPKMLLNWPNLSHLRDYDLLFMVEMLRVVFVLKANACVLSACLGCERGGENSH